MDNNILVWIFGAITAVSVIYFLFSIVTNADDVGGLEGDSEFSLTIIAAFAAVFGAVGLLGTLSSWNILVTLLAALIVGVVAGRGALAVLRFVMRQQSEENPEKMDDLIGQSARVTIDSPAGATGEAMIEANYVMKYAVKEINGAALQRGDAVEVVDTAGGMLIVKKKRS